MAPPRGIGDSKFRAVFNLFYFVKQFPNIWNYKITNKLAKLTWTTLDHNVKATSQSYKKDSNYYAMSLAARINISQIILIYGNISTKVGSLEG